MLALTLFPTMRPNTVVGRTHLFFYLVGLTSPVMKPLLYGVSPSFQVDGDKEVESSSGQFPRLDRWLAGELIKSLKSIPELSFRVQGYVQDYKVHGPRGCAILHMIFRHLDLDRNRGALSTTQSIFQVTLQGYSIKDLQEFSSLTMKTLSSIPADDWPHERMLGEWLFHQLRNV